MKKKKWDIIKIPCPTNSEIDKYLDIWNGDEKFYKPEKALIKLFNGCHANNKDKDDVLIKVYALNDSYDTFVLNQVRMAQHIANQNIDENLRADNLGLAIVDKIRKGHSIRNRYGTEINFYSFATKYCSFHKPDKYPLFDSNVERALKYFKKRHCSKLFTFNNTDLRVYEAFVGIIRKFQEIFGLQRFSLRDIDKYLYLVGRELNPPKKKS